MWLAKGATLVRAEVPEKSGALISRSLWVIFIGEWGVWTQ
jgi:hypothetical protein